MVHVIATTIPIKHHAPNMEHMTATLFIKNIDIKIDRKKINVRCC
jgi:hypothetical protein